MQMHRCGCTGENLSGDLWDLKHGVKDLYMECSLSILLIVNVFIIFFIKALK